MQLSKSIALAMLAATSLAQHHVHRREAEAEADPALAYVTVYNTFYVTEDNAAQPVPTTTTSAPVVSAPPPVSSVPAPAVTTSLEVTTSPEHPAAASTTSSAPAPAVTSASSSPSPSSSSSSGSSSPGSESAGPAGALGITYSPYSNSGGCKSSDEISSEVAKLSGYSVIRLYGSDCNQVAAVNSAKAAGQKLFVGVFDMGNIENELQTIHDALNGDWSDVVTVNIGNELVNDGQASVEQVQGYVNQGRSKLSSLNYNGPVVSVDTFIAVINNPGLCSISDYMAVNAHAFFDGGVTSAQAGSWANLQIERVWSACGGQKKVTIVESGWPSQGNSNGKAVASPADQSAAISSLKDTVGNDCYLFTAFNDLWKSPGYLGVEQWWGIYGSSAN